ncbi:MAG: phosphatidylserine decarboxylase [Pseudomonadota bacterium]|nr:phosphatidylserine decarboxylase [Pseudomonadota bacterium]
MDSHHRNTDLEDGWIAADGWAVLAIAGIATIILALISLPVGTFALGLMLWLRYTLRAPRRLSPDDPGLVLAPADGVVIEVADDVDEAASHPDMAGARRVTIRTGLADAQLQRSPVAGRIIDNFLIPGLFRGGEALGLMRRDNERREISIETTDGEQFLIVQIGTATARQLVCRFGPGKFLAAGAPLGMARIGGLTDIVIPADYRLRIEVGRTVVAGETILAGR